MNKPVNKQSKLLSVPVAAEQLGISKSQMYKMVQLRIIPSYPVCERRFKIAQEDLDKYIQSRKIASVGIHN